MKKTTLEIIEDEFCINLQNLYRSNSCRVPLNFEFPLDFVPKLKPKIGHLIPSPMHLGAKAKNLLKLEEFNLDDKHG
jgi:hypothetical protein